MLRHSIAGLSLLTLVSAPLMADHNHEASSFWNKERIGRAVGAGLGAIAGSQVGKGDGRNAAVALGTLAGYYLGGNLGRDLSAADQTSISQNTERALETSESQAYYNPKTGVRSQVRVTPIPNHERYSTSAKHDVFRGETPRLQHVPGLTPIDKRYRTTGRVNVRSGPSKRFAVTDQLAAYESVRVVGRVIDSDWVLVSRQGGGEGFVYEPLLIPEHQNNRVTKDSSRDRSIDNECREVTQEVENRYGNREQATTNFCRSARGQWIES